MQSQGPSRVLSIPYPMNLWSKSGVDLTGAEGGRGVRWLKGCGYFGRLDGKHSGQVLCGIGNIYFLKQFFSWAPILKIAIFWEHAPLILQT